ncbi:unnamed protein product [Mucor fragilis]
MDTDAPTLNPVAYLDMLPVIKVNSCRPLGYRVKGVQVLFQEPKFQAYGTTLLLRHFCLLTMSIVNKEALHLSCEFLRLFTVGRFSDRNTVRPSFSPRHSARGSS